MAEQTGVLELLCSSAKIKRDRGAIELHNHLRETDSEGLKQLENSVRLLLQDADAPWERKHGALMGFKELLGLGVTDENLLKCSDEFTGVAKECALHMLEDSESRVRLAAGIFCVTSCSSHGICFNFCYGHLIRTDSDITSQ